MAYLLSFVRNVGAFLAFCVLGPPRVSREGTEGHPRVLVLHHVKHQLGCDGVWWFTPTKEDPLAIYCTGCLSVIPKPTRSQVVDANRQNSTQIEARHG